MPYMVAPVPYSIWSELNGSISSDSTIQPNFGVGCGHNELVEPVLRACRRRCAEREPRSDRRVAERVVRDHDIGPGVSKVCVPDQTPGVSAIQAAEEIACPATID